MTKVDLIVLGFVALTSFIGWRKGLVASALSLAGIVLGAWLGSRLAPELLEGGTSSPYTPLAALAGAAVGAILLETLGTLAGAALRSKLRKPRLSTFDSAGGLVLGAVAGLALVWVVAAVALLLPGQADLRRGAQGSALLRRLNEVIPPTDLLNALARIDPFPAITGPAAPVAPPDPRVAHAPSVLRAAPSVVRVLGTACGIGVEGSGWVARRDLVVTAAHVVAGQEDTIVELQSGERLPADVVARDHVFARSSPARGLRCTRRRCAGCRRDDDLCGSSPHRWRVRGPCRRRTRRAELRTRAGIDRRLRPLVFEQLQHAQRTSERRHEINACRAFA